MNAYLAGGGIGIIGLLSGVSAALWFRYKFAVVQGRLKALIITHTHELEAHGRTLDAAVADADKYEEDRDAAEEIAERYRQRLAKVRERELAHTTDDDLLAIANDQFVRLLDSEETEEARTGDSDQDGGDS
jgi:hypothetical protein